MRAPLASIRRRLAWPVALLLAAVAAMSLPAPAPALELEIVNQSGRSPEDVYVTVASPNTYEVTGAANDVPQKLSEISAGKLTIDKLISGRVFISYGAGVQEGVPFNSPTRFDMAEMTVTPAPADVANLTAVDQFAIAMRMEALNGSGETLETLGEANADTIWNALQQIPGGPQATVRDGDEILRVLSPVHSTAYPLLSEYVKSLVGQTLTLHTALFQTPEGVSEYSGSVAADGSIVLQGTYTSSAPLAEPPPPTITIPASQLFAEIYAPTTEHNNFEAAIKRDLLAGFSTGFWGGNYGNDALSFCDNPQSKLGRQFCPEGFNQPAFGDARASLSSFPTCNQYAAVMNQYSDSYGSAYSDAAKKVAVSLNQASTKTLRLTILPDSGSAMPVNSGNPNCGAVAPAFPPAAPLATSTVAPLAASPAVRVKLFKKAQVKGVRARVGRIVCTGRCGRVKLIAKKGRKVLGRGRASVKGSKAALMLRLTKPGKRLLVRKRRLKAKVTVWVTPPGGKSVRRRWAVLLINKPARKQHRR